MKNIETYKEKVNLALKRFLEKKLDDGKYSPKIKNLIENIIEYNMRGGKRIRPLAIIFAYKCFKDDEKILDASICIELMQAYLLIHDDIIDNADLRRGKPSMHKIYSSSGEEFGKSMAILAGNLCSHYVYDSIIESKFSDKEKIEAIRYIDWIAERENYGQALDIVPGFEIKEEDVMKIYELKTATYTMQGPLYLGACLASASPEKLQEYGKNIGIAFQIQDDIIGVFGKVEETGKPNDSDIKEGKKTLLIVKALELAGKEDRRFLLDNYGKKSVSEAEMEKIREIIKKLSLDYCIKKIDEMIEKGKKSILNLNLRDEGKSALLDMADYIKNLI